MMGNFFSDEGIKVRQTRHWLIRAILATMTAALAACGGGGDGSEAPQQDNHSIDQRARALAVTWSLCNQYWEGGTCTFSGTRNVKYGTTTNYVIKTFTGSAYCHNSVFGDPAYGQSKQCWVSSEVVTPPTETWTLCNQYWEGGSCTFSGTRRVKFGTETQYTIKTFTGGTACTTSVFGDPAYGQHKKCWVSSIDSGVVTPPSKTRIYTGATFQIPGSFTEGKPADIAIRFYGKPLVQPGKLVGVLYTDDGNMTYLGMADNHLLLVPSNNWSGYMQYTYKFYLPDLNIPNGQTKRFRFAVQMHGGLALNAPGSGGLNYPPLMAQYIDCDNTRLPAAIPYGQESCMVGTLDIKSNTAAPIPAPTQGNVVTLTGTPWTP